MIAKTFKLALGAAAIAGTVAYGTPQSNALTFQGVFNSTTPACSTTDICNGLGTSNFSYGQFAPGGFGVELSFAGETYPSNPWENSSNTGFNASFNAGTLQITNGSIGVGTFPAFQTNYPAFQDTRGDFTTFINLKISDSDDTKTGDFLIAYNSTVNVNVVLNSYENADFVYFPRHPEFGAFYILEGATRSDAVASVGILAIDPPALLFAGGFQAIPGQTNGFLAPLPPGSIDPNTGYFIPNTTNFIPNANSSVPEPFTIIGTLIGGTAALRMRKKLSSANKA